ncbi:MAG: 30S ribosomal protein S12 methylthiotransferase RimO [Candidatus Omnitrophica bacterium]|nr:30S ribosomal protein S12 methylthiotransferase RimO [Candidatus Omnitrophota bacterium]
MKVGILSLGCPRNLVDSETMLGRLKSKNRRIVDIKDADVAIVNTCAFIEDAKRESIDAILNLIGLKREGAIRKIIVAGCLAQRYPEELRKNFKEVDAFVGTLNINHNEINRYLLTPRHSVYLKISEGCANKCSYCVIPAIKGPFVSRGMASIINEVRRLDRLGVKELNIVGQDITLYGRDIFGRPSLAGLLKKIVAAADNIKWIRLLYMNPERLDDELIEVIGGEPKICKYIDMPLQHINDRILKLMNRNTSRKRITSLIRKIRKAVPGAALRTSLIAGFPSETKKEFEELVDFIGEVKFERLGAFIYSREEGTAAYHLKGQVPQKTKEERFDRIMAAQQEIAKGVNSGFINKEIDALIEEKDAKDAGLYLARSQYDAPEVDGIVYVRSQKKLKPGDLVRARIEDTLEYDLVARYEPSQ